MFNFFTVICNECTSRSSTGRVNFCPKNVNLCCKILMKICGGEEDDANMNNLMRIVWLGI